VLILMRLPDAARSMVTALLALFAATASGEIALAADILPCAQFTHEGPPQPIARGDHPTSLETAAGVCVAALGMGITPIARVTSHDPHDATRILDCGAQGVMVPHVQNAAEARAIVEDCLYAPKGHRSAFGSALVTDIVFGRIAGGEVLDPAFRESCVGTYQNGPIKHVVALDADGQITLSPTGQPTYLLVPYQNRTFTLMELEGYRVEFKHDEAGVVDTIIFHQPNGTFQARRISV
jgi:hypothetical protein